MIVSASYKTDIPAFFGPWFRARLAQGEVRVNNPYGGPARTVSLAPADVDAFVFWTRNAGPFFPTLAELAELQLARGDYAGAAQTLADVRAICEGGLAEGAAQLESASLRARCSSAQFSPASRSARESSAFS